MHQLIFIAVTCLASARAQNIIVENDVVAGCLDEKIIVKLGQAVLVENLDDRSEIPEEYSPETQLPKWVTSDATVCAVQILDEASLRHNVKTFASRDEAVADGFKVTHHGKCGGCSELKYLSLYLTKKDLTKPVRKCGIRSGIFKRRLPKCLGKVGFEGKCLQAWVWNVENTRKHCSKICLTHWLKRSSYNNELGNLNECMLCDETSSGPGFKYLSGRTRRNSGIESAIGRRDGEMAALEHCY